MASSRRVKVDVFSDDLDEAARQAAKNTRKSVKKLRKRGKQAVRGFKRAAVKGANAAVEAATDVANRGAQAVNEARIPARARLLRRQASQFGRTATPVIQEGVEAVGQLSRGAASQLGQIVDDVRAAPLRQLPGALVDEVAERATAQNIGGAAGRGAAGVVNTAEDVAEATARTGREATSAFQVARQGAAPTPTAPVGRGDPNLTRTAASNAATRARALGQPPPPAGTTAPAPAAPAAAQQPLARRILSAPGAALRGVRNAPGAALRGAGRLAAGGVATLAAEEAAARGPAAAAQFVTEDQGDGALGTASNLLRRGANVTRGAFGADPIVPAESDLIGPATDEFTQPGGRAEQLARTLPPSSENRSARSFRRGLLAQRGQLPGLQPGEGGSFEDAAGRALTAALPNAVTPADVQRRANQTAEPSATDVDPEIAAANEQLQSAQQRFAAGENLNPVTDLARGTGLIRNERTGAITQIRRQPRVTADGAEPPRQRQVDVPLHRLNFATPTLALGNEAIQRRRNQPPAAPTAGEQAQLANAQTNRLRAGLEQRGQVADERQQALENVTNEDPAVRETAGLEFLQRATQNPNDPVARDQVNLAASSVLRRLAGNLDVLGDINPFSSGRTLSDAYADFTEGRSLEESIGAAMGTLRKEGDNIVQANGRVVAGLGEMEPWEQAAVRQAILSAGGSWG